MARKIDIEHFGKRFERDDSQKHRMIATRDKRVYFLIVCEGTKTEPNYFSSFGRTLPPYTLDIETQGKGCDPLGVVNAAIELRKSSNKPLNSVWAVFDRDEFPLSRFHQAIEKAKVNHIKCAWSNEAFELWYILHFQYLDTPMSRSDYKKYIEKEINRKMQEQGGLADRKRKYTYLKNATGMRQLLTEYGNETRAIQWAQRLTDNFDNEEYGTHNPCTMVFRMVEELNNPGSVL